MQCRKNFNVSDVRKFVIEEWLAVSSGSRQATPSITKFLTLQSCFLKNLPDPDVLIVPGTKLTNTSPFLGNKPSKIFKQMKQANINFLFSCNSFDVRSSPNDLKNEVGRYCQRSKISWNFWTLPSQIWSRSRHGTTNFPNSKSRIFTTKFLFWFFLMILRTHFEASLRFRKN